MITLGRRGSVEGSGHDYTIIRISDKTVNKRMEMSNVFCYSGINSNKQALKKNFGQRKRLTYVFWFWIFNKLMLLKVNLAGKLSKKNVYILLVLLQ